MAPSLMIGGLLGRVIASLLLGGSRPKSIFFENGSFFFDSLTFGTRWFLRIHKQADKQDAQLWHSWTNRVCLRFAGEYWRPTAPMRASTSQGQGWCCSFPFPNSTPHSFGCVFLKGYLFGGFEGNTRRKTGAILP